MVDIFEQKLKELNEFTDSASQKVGEFFKKAVNKGEEYAVRGKIQIEIKKLKWDLKQMYIELGRYVALKNRENCVMDFSNDDKYIRLLDKIEKQRQYITERFKDKGVSEDTGKNDDDAQKLLDKPLS